MSWEKNCLARRTSEPIVPPLKVSSDIVANHPGMVPGTNPADYLTDDIEFETMEVDEFRIQDGQPLIKPDHPPPLTTMMRRLHEWYMERCHKSGKHTLTMRIKEEHDLIGMDILNVEFDESFQLYNQKALHKTLVTCYCL